MTDRWTDFDWEKIEAIAKCRFDGRIRSEIITNVRWYRERSDAYASDASRGDFIAAIKALNLLIRTEFSRFQLEPIEDELTTVQWFLDVMAQAPSEQIVNIKYFLYSRIWKSIEVAGIKLTQGKGVPDHRLSHAQKVFREICKQTGIEFTSDQALANALKRALRATSATGAK